MTGSIQARWIGEHAKEFNTGLDLFDAVMATDPEGLLKDSEGYQRYAFFLCLSVEDEIAEWEEVTIYRCLVCGSHHYGVCRKCEHPQDKIELTSYTAVLPLSTVPQITESDRLVEIRTIRLCIGENCSDVTYKGVDMKAVTKIKLSIKMIFKIVDKYGRAFIPEHEDAQADGNWSGFTAITMPLKRVDLGKLNNPKWLYDKLMDTINSQDALESTRGRTS